MTNLFIGQLEAKLLHTRLDSVPAGETMARMCQFGDGEDNGRSNLPDGNISGEAEVFGFEDFVR